MDRPPRTCSTLIAAFLVVVLAGCTAESSPDVQPSATTTSSSTSSPSGSVTPLPEGVVPLSDLPQNSSVAPGRYAGEFTVTPHPELPRAVVTVPAGYVAGGAGGVHHEAGGWRELSLWTVDKVATDACTGDPVTYVDPGPTARDLADALVALPVWDSSTPEAVTVGGYDGLVMDFDVPDPLPKSCGDEPEHWVDEVGGTQGVGPGKRQRLWILDVEDQRVLIMAGWFPAGVSDGEAGVTPDQAKELVQMAANVTFVLPSS